VSLRAAAGRVTKGIETRAAKHLPGEKEGNMSKEFYTEKDIEDLVKRGVMSLEVNDDVVLTELAYEKAGRLGLQLQRGGADVPPAAPVRPYLSQKKSPLAAASSAGPTSRAPAPGPASQPESDLPARIRAAVLAKLGSEVDPALLDVIIQRVLKSTGVK
jgi:hypothetical protein